MQTTMPNPSRLPLVSFFLRVGLATVFMYAAVASFLQPDDWVSFLPQWMSAIAPLTTILILFSLYEIFLAVWLFSNIKTYYAAVLVSITLLGILLQNVAGMDVLFRDIAILFAAMALGALTKE